MAGLKIKHYAKTGLIRSVGDEPNGIVAIDFYSGEARFIVHPKVKPPAAEIPGMNYKEFKGVDPLEQGAVVVSAEKVVEASLHCNRTVAMIWRAAVATLQKAADDQRLLMSFDVELAISAAQLAKEVRDHMVINGFISKA